MTEQSVPKTEQRELEQHAFLRAEREQAMGLLDEIEWPIEVEPVRSVSVRKYRDRENVVEKIALFEGALAKYAAKLRKRGFVLETDASEPIETAESRKAAQASKPKKTAPGEVDAGATEEKIRAKIAEVQAELEAMDRNAPDFAKKAGRRRTEITRLTKRLPTSARTPDLKPQDESDAIDAAEARQAEPTAA
jgi:hypothetical protein